MGLEPHGLPSTAFVVPQEQRGTQIRRGPVIAGALAMVAIAAAAVFVLTRGTDASADPLFVLPAGNDWELTDGVVTDDVDVPATAERFISRGRLFGTPDGDGFRDLRSEVNYDESPLPGAEWDEIDTPWGDAYRRVDDSITIARQFWGEDTWQVASSPDDLIHVYDILGGDVFDLAIVAVFIAPEEADSPSTAFTMASPDGSMFTVRTAASSSPLFDVATYAERLEQIDIDGTDAWIVTDELDDGTETTVTWSANANHTVTVRSTTDRDAVVAVARSLQPVAEDEWTAAFPKSELD